mgnify:CR=1 FL=1
MTPELINGYWLTTDTHLGTSNTSGITEAQKTNATNIYNYFSAQGWSLSAIAGMLGNMQHESFLSPAYIEGTNRWRLPNSASSLSDVPNTVMQNFYREYYGDDDRGYGIGLVQWDGLGITRQKLVGFAINNGLNWYDGNTQCLRITDEQTRNLQWQDSTISGTRWTWSNYPTNSQTPEESAHIWRICYEVGGDASDQTRRENARYWYDYFSAGPGPGPGPGPEPVEGWITGEAFSNLALAYNGQYMPYDQYDCYAFVQKVWRDIPAVSTSDTLCNPASGHSGTNTFWRMNISPYNSWTFQTTSPDSQNPCPVLWYKDTIDNCIATYGEIPAGAILFHKIADDGNPPIPSYYAGDGIGNFVHCGIYCGNDEVMQSGGRDSGSIPGGGVHKSTYDPDAWNYVGFVVWVDPVGSEPGPGPGPGPGPEPEPPKKYWLLFLLNKKREVKKNVRYYYSRQL